MTLISGILCQIVTAADAGSGTDGNVYLGFGGREFNLNRPGQDFEAGFVDEFLLASKGGPYPHVSYPFPTVVNPQFNDPSFGYELSTSDLVKTPTYIRFAPASPGDTWQVLWAMVVYYVQSTTGASTHLVEGSFQVPAGFKALWFGEDYGEIIFLTADSKGDARDLLGPGRRLGRRRED